MGRVRDVVVLTGGPLPQGGRRPHGAGLESRKPRERKMEVAMREGSYLRDVEQYFLQLTGWGVMLSSADYELIDSWRRAGVPKEVVLRSIRDAVARMGAVGEGGLRRPWRLSDLREAVESGIAASLGHDPSSHGGEDERRRGTALADQVASRLGRLASVERDGRVRALYLEARRRLMESDLREAAEVLDKVDEVESYIYDELFDSLDEETKRAVLAEAEGMIHEGGKYMTSGAYEESLLQLRNTVLARRFGIKGLLTD